MMMIYSQISYQTYYATLNLQQNTNMQIHNSKQIGDHFTFQAIHWWAQKSIHFQELKSTDDFFFNAASAEACSLSSKTSLGKLLSNSLEWLTLS